MHNVQFCIVIRESLFLCSLILGVFFQFSLTPCNSLTVGEFISPSVVTTKEVADPRTNLLATSDPGFLSGKPHVLRAEFLDRFTNLVGETFRKTVGKSVSHHLSGFGGLFSLLIKFTDRTRGVSVSVDRIVHRGRSLVD